MINWSASDVTCDVYVENMTSEVRAADLRAAASRRHVFSNTEPVFFMFLSNVAEPAVCLFGIAGNILNLIILTRKQIQRSVILSFKIRKNCEFLKVLKICTVQFDKKFLVGYTYM